MITKEHWRYTSVKGEYGGEIMSYAGCTTCGDKRARWWGSRSESLARRHAEKHGHLTWYSLFGWREGKFDGR